jgi:predicted GNAT family N-acyltransferase
VEYRLARDEAELEEARALRVRVFTGEQGVALETENPDGLHDALQVVAVEDGTVVGTCRVLMLEGAAWLGRLAVAPSARRRGLGRGILAAAEASAREAGARVMRLHSQDYIEDMYTELGYVQFGEPFVDHGIAHVSMEKPLA